MSFAAKKAPPPPRPNQPAPRPAQPAPRPPQGASRPRGNVCLGFLKTGRCPRIDRGRGRLSILTFLLLILSSIIIPFLSFLSRRVREDSRRQRVTRGPDVLVSPVKPSVEVPTQPRASSPQPNGKHSRPYENKTKPSQEVLEKNRDNFRSLSTSPSRYTCRKCGNTHMDECRWRGQCWTCGRGHSQKVCPFRVYTFGENFKDTQHTHPNHPPHVVGRESRSG